MRLSRPNTDDISGCEIIKKALTLFRVLHLLTDCAVVAAFKTFSTIVDDDDDDGYGDVMAKVFLIKNYCLSCALKFYSTY